MKIVPRIAILLLLQTAALAAMIGMKQHTLMTGTEVLLETEPIDPRSLFRGDYVRLNYKISQLELEQLDGDDKFERGEEVFVVLSPGEKYWNAVSIHHGMPQPAAPAVAIQGQAEWTADRIFDRDTATEHSGSVLQAKYGIENYFVPEGEGRELEMRGGNNAHVVDIRIAVDKNGDAGIKAVLVDGEEKYVESLF